LTGFATATRQGVELLVGQTLTLNLQMSPSTLQETVTVTGEAPLIATQSSSIGGTIDPRQMSELPTAGRNWMSLALVAPGNRTNPLSGSLIGNFRHSSCSARDPVLNRVLPYKNQQISGTVGGPIVLNKTHFFGNYEYEHQPLTSIWNTPYPAFNVTLAGTRTV